MNYIKSFRFVILITLLSILNSLTTVAQYISKDQLKLLRAVDYISSSYVDTINEEKLVDDAITDVLKRLDPHSSYIPVKEVEKMNEPLTGNFDGIGVTFQVVDDTMLVISTISGAPSEKVGIMAGDRIISVNDTSIVGMSSTDIQKRVRGPKGTSVEVKVMRRGESQPLSFNITRDKIPIYSVDASYMVDDEIGYIKINRYSKTTTEEYIEAFEKLKQKGMKKLIIDLQGNGGGYLSVAQELVSMFIEDNKMIVYTKGEKTRKEELKSQTRLFYENGTIIPIEKRKFGQFRNRDNDMLVILTDESSASASEITAGALQDWDRAVIVGRRTFGKGLVQKQFKLPDGSEMRLTTARYYTPSGRCIQKPYEKNNKEGYDKDLLERFDRGEYMHEDSIHFSDTLEYKTINLGRTIYGGGGIMPDIFVPLDTTYGSKYYRKVLHQGIINKFCLQYTDTNRDKLKSKYSGDEGFKKFAKEFSTTDAMMDSIRAMADRAKIEFVEEDYKRSETFMRDIVKAIIARDVWSETEYYQLINRYNPIYNKGIEVLKNAETYKSGFVNRANKNVKSDVSVSESKDKKVKMKTKTKSK